MKLSNMILANILVIFAFIVLGFIIATSSRLIVMVMATASFPLSVLVVYLKNKFIYTTEYSVEMISLQVALTNAVTEAILLVYLVFI